jgi:hypothetical protein
VTSPGQPRCDAERAFRASIERSRPDIRHGLDSIWQVAAAPQGEWFGVIHFSAIFVLFLLSPSCHTFWQRPL